MIFIGFIWKCIHPDLVRSPCTQRPMDIQKSFNISELFLPTAQLLCLHRDFWTVDVYSVRYDISLPHNKAVSIDQNPVLLCRYTARLLRQNPPPTYFLNGPSLSIQHINSYHGKSAERYGLEGRSVLTFQLCWRCDAHECKNGSRNDWICDVLAMSCWHECCAVSTGCFVRITRHRANKEQENSN